jgi:hypothetical protein
MSNQETPVPTANAHLETKEPRIQKQSNKLPADVSNTFNEEQSKGRIVSLDIPIRLLHLKKTIISNPVLLSLPPRD